MALRIKRRLNDTEITICLFRLKNSMLADEADNPGFLLLLEQVVLFVAMIMMALVMVIMMVVLTVGNSKGKRGPRSMQQKNRV